MHVFDAAPRISFSPAQVIASVDGRPAGLDVVEPWLRQGDWDLILTRSGGRNQPVAAIRRGVALPDHLCGPALSRTTRWGMVRSNAFIRRPLPIAQAEGRRDFQADMWLVRHSGKQLLFDLEQFEVLRWEPKPVSAQYETLRRAYGRHVPSVDFMVSDSRRAIRESMAAGDAILQASIEAKEHACKILLRGIASLVESESRSNPGGLDFPSIGQLGRSSPVFEVRESASALMDLVGGNPAVVPVHGEINGENILVSEMGNPVAIDFGGIHLGPFFADAIGVANLLPKVWAQGGLDRDLGRVWEVAGLQPIRWDATTARLGLLAHAAVSAERRMRQTQRPLRALKQRAKAARIRNSWENSASRIYLTKSSN